MEQPILLDVGSWAVRGSDDDARFPHDMIVRKLIAGEVDLETTLKPVPVMDCARSVGLTDVCYEQVSAEQVLNDKSGRSALTMCGVLGTPPREAAGARHVVSAPQEERKARSISTNV